MNPSKTFYNDSGAVIGVLKNGIFEKRVKRDKHKMVIYDAYGIDEKTIQEIKDEARFVVVEETDTGNRYQTPMLVFLERGFVKNHAGEQRFLPLKFWDAVIDGVYYQRVPRKNEDQEELSKNW